MRGVTGGRQVAKSLQEMASIRTTQFGSNIIYKSAHLRNRRSFLPASEWFARVDIEFPVFEDEVRTSDLHDRAFCERVSGFKPGNRGFAEGKREIQRFEPIGLDFALSLLGELQFLLL